MAQESRKVASFGARNNGKKRLIMIKFRPR